VRRVGLVFLAIGLSGFLLASGARARGETPEAAALAGSPQDRIREAWETWRWLFVGVAVMGVVFTVFPGKKT
jgi:hypothetical protein